MVQIRMEVGGMTCQGCVRSVTRVLESVPGVSAVAVSLERGEALVSTGDSTVSSERLIQAVEAAGFDARVANS
ncbi:MAG: heavy-metal-associated domain-containing protein [Burkholderiales bacterium]|nr:heavy-metal-associated domain-containing protein [Burkholderiales bacterium]